LIDRVEDNLSRFVKSQIPKLDQGKIRNQASSVLWLFSCFSSSRSSQPHLYFHKRISRTSRVKLARAQCVSRSFVLDPIKDGSILIGSHEAGKLDWPSGERFVEFVTLASLLHRGKIRNQALPVLRVFCFSSCDSSEPFAHLTSGCPTCG
jgi:hypothetical protein